MSCTDQVCGTGGWAGPLPGDPDNNSVLRATPAFGGIDVSWAMPATNPFAVAHTVIRRGRTNNFNAAVFLASVGGDFFYDKSDTAQPVEYFYWIQFVSVNGTYGDWIGPASAVAKPLIEKVIEDLTGKIDAGVLAQSLKKEIDKITLNYAELVAEAGSRIRGESILAAALAEVKIEAGQAVSFVNEEIITRRDGDSALASQISVIAAANTNNTAAIIEEKTARVTADGALTNMYTTVLAKTDANTAAITNETTARTTADSALTSQYTTLLAKTDSNAAAILDEKSARATADSALTTKYNAVLAATQNNAAALTVETTARTTADSALASQITTAQSTLNGSISSVQTTMQTQINAVTGELDAIYTAKVDVNGMVGGFGIYGTPTSVEAGFDVDRFWVGRTSANKRKPFIIENGTVYINDAAINKLTFSKLRDEAGTFIVQNGKVKANYIDTNGLVIRDTYGNPIFGAGTALSTAHISGLGALATQNSVAYSSVTGAKPPTNADNTASNTAAAITNQGTLATRNAAAIGTHVTFPDGSLMNTADFVNRLSKINDTNISTFMSSAAIGNAYIGIAAVDTLKIAGNAVTVPVANKGVATIGNGSFQYLVTTNISMDEPGVLLLQSGGYLSYGTGWTLVEVELFLNGVRVASAAADEALINPVLMAVETVPAGVHTAQLRFRAGSKATFHYPLISVTGVKR